MQAWLTELSLYMVYSFDLLNVHVRVKNSHCTVHCSIVLYTSNLQGPMISCHTHSMGQSIIINNEVKWISSVLCIYSTFILRGKGCLKAFHHLPLFATCVNPNCYCLCSLSVLLLPYTLGFALATDTFIKSKFAFIFCSLPRLTF